VSEFTLYQLDAAMLAAIEGGYTVNEETGEIVFTPDDLDRLEMLRADKLEGCALFIKSLDSMAEAIKAEEQALKRRREAIENKAKRMRGYVYDSLVANPVTIDTARATVRLKKGRPHVEIEDMGKLPPQYLRVKTEADKTAITRAIKEGHAVPGAILTPGGMVLEIR